jgi:type I restriction enzyme, S subunit
VLLRSNDKNPKIQVFLLNHLRTKRYVLHIESIFRGNANQASITLKDLFNFYYPSPQNLIEKEAIATVLSDMDARITSLDHLIAKKRDLKQAVMQELLTGKRRLPEFHGEWKNKTLNKIVQIPINDGPHLTPEFLENGIPFLSVNNIVNNRINFTELRRISLEDHHLFSKKCKPKMNDLLFGKAASVGAVAYVDLEIEFNIWSPLALIRIDNLNESKFVYYCLQSSALIRQIKILTNSSSQGNIGMREIGKFKLYLPPKDEQRAIATVLSDMDDELSALEQQRDKMKNIRQGMMQELLTGRIRLVKG